MEGEKRSNVPIQSPNPDNTNQQENVNDQNTQNEPKPEKEAAKSGINFSVQEILQMAGLSAVMLFWSVFNLFDNVENIPSDPQMQTQISEMNNNIKNFIYVMIYALVFYVYIRIEVIGYRRDLKKKQENNLQAVQT